MKKLLSLLLALVMVLGLTACGTATPETTTAPTETETVGASFTVVVTDVDGIETTFTYTTDAETVGEFLLAEGLLTGYQGDYGLFITAVNGIPADWDTENAYWAFYVDGEYGMSGVDSTPITDGAVYSFVKTISYTELGEGSTSFYLTVQDVDGTVTKFLIHTDAATVGEALQELGLLDGYQGDYGLYITAVNGITADWDTEKSYWGFYIDGEYAQTGVDLTEITADASYELVKTVSEE